VNQEDDLAKNRDLANQLYIAGGPLEFLPDPPCHSLAVECHKLPACTRRWDCNCKHGGHRPPYPSSAKELQEQLDYSKELTQELNQVQPKCWKTRDSTAPEKQKCDTKEYETRKEKVRQDFDRRWKLKHPHVNFK